MSMSNLIQIDIYFMAREKEWDSFLMEVVIIKDGRQLLKKTIKKGSSY